MNNPQLIRHAAATIIAMVLASPADPAIAATTLSVEATADTFLTSYSQQADSDMSSYGAMMISSPQANLAQGIAEVRTMENLVAYNTASIKADFDAQYGTGNWHVTDVRMKWYTNFDIQGVPANNNQFNVPHAGYFGISYFGNDSWFNPVTSGPTGLAVSSPAVTWNSVYSGGAWSNLFAGQTSVGTFYYPTGIFNGTTNCSGEVCAPRFWDLNLAAPLVDDILTGGFLSFHGYAADDQVVYLVNQLTKPSAHPQLFISAEAGLAPVPVPAAVWLFGSALAGLGIIGRRKRA